MHIKPKDLLEFFLFGLIVVALLVLCSLESAPLPILLWTLLPIAGVLWIVWFIMLALERKKEARRRLKIYRNGEWVDTDDFVPHPRIAQFYDQDNDPHDNPDYVDYTKEKQA